MQAKLVDSMRPGGWIYEIKFDGYRALALRGGSQTRVSRSEKQPTLICLCYKSAFGSSSHRHREI